MGKIKKVKLATLNEVSQIISALAVVISLIYVGVQINQNTKATQAAMRQSIADNDIVFLSLKLDSNILANASYKISNELELTPLELDQLISEQHVNFRVFENAFYQYQQGLLEEETWDRYQLIIEDLLTKYFPSSKMWNDLGSSFSKSFQIEINRILNGSN